VSERALQAGGVEIKLRNEETRQIIPLEEVIEKVRETLSALLSQIDAGLGEHVLGE